MKHITSALLMLAVSGIVIPEAAAIPVDPTDNPCVSKSSGQLSLSSHAVTLGESVAISAEARPSAGLRLLDVHHLRR